MIYNEVDPHAVAWLRNLIALGELPDGAVDERSIVDLRGDDLAGCDELHLFAGIGVWARAIAEAEEATGYRLARPLFTGSCPCQPLSAAGRRKGHVDQRHLWPAFHRLIAERRPATILGEQVASKDGREWMAAVRHDLEASGYAVGTAILPAGGFGAPHIRYRIFFIAILLAEILLAEPSDEGSQGRLFGGPDSGRRDLDRHAGRRGAAGGLGDASSAGTGPDAGNGDCPQGEAESLDGHPSRSSAPLGNNGAAGGLADADGFDRPQVSQGNDALDEQRPQIGRGQLQPARPGADSRTVSRDHQRGSSAFGPAENMARMAWPRSTDGVWQDADWIFCRDGKWRPIEPGSFPLVDGSAFLLGSGGPYEGMSRAGMLRGYGNAVVLPVARAFVECVLEAVDVARQIKSPRG
jgi:DNA (cytosine-5)-methyltransferase 1